MSPLIKSQTPSPARSTANARRMVDARRAPAFRNPRPPKRTTPTSACSPRDQGQRGENGARVTAASGGGGEQRGSRALGGVVSGDA